MEISQKYGYYIIRIILEGKYFYCLWGANNKNMDDQFLINRDNLIIKFRSINEIRKYSDKIKKNNFRTLRFSKWINELLKIRVKSTAFDFDMIRKIFTGKLDPLQINSGYLNNYIDFINLFDDYAIQVKNKKLMKLSSKNQVRLLWLLAYDYYFWKVQGKEKVKTVKLISTKWDPIKFREEFRILYDSFENSFTWL